MPENLLSKIDNNDIMGHIFSFLNDTDSMRFMLTSKKYRQLVISLHYYQNLTMAWSELLKSDIKAEQMDNLKLLAATMYERGLIRKIIDDLNKVNLKAVIIPALLNGYEFKPENHVYLELASHLLFFNKSSDILFAQDGENNDKFPLFHEVKPLLERYAQQTQRDSFYLLFTSSAQVIYYNKLTRSAEIFICPHAGWGIYGCPKDHIFSVLLQRTIGHVDCLVEVPNVELEQNINLRDALTLDRAISDGSLFLSLYRAYRQTYVDDKREYYSFERASGYCGHYYKSYPEALNGNARNGKLEQFIDYLMENHFPMMDNHLYNRQLEDRTPIILQESQYLEQLRRNGRIPLHSPAYYRILGRGLTMFSNASTANAGREVLQAIASPATPTEQIYSDRLDLNPFSISKTIAHHYYSQTYVRFNTREDLIAFLLFSIEKLDYVDYGETILERLDYGYLLSLLLKNNMSSWHEVEEWLREEYGAHEQFAALEPRVHNIFERGIAQQLSSRPQREEPREHRSKCCIIC